jgi:hypothetical protein
MRLLRWLDVSEDRLESSVIVVAPGTADGKGYSGRGILRGGGGSCNMLCFCRSVGESGAVAYPVVVEVDNGEWIWSVSRWRESIGVKGCC